ncbi:PaaI family thioesterase [Denitratisoma oestradiolicum]|uniref:Thioesterase domain-containing protein n=1 Tax=Denitratisoma oestradiolicum TaxID=311182 RepID=A0A6S6Y4G4_9PROT|nr:PaaI family thioesterase [Denitratisoma oestradiolicum]CAB1370250.1 conserved protein of unknown function [Denitratisoma oestradiolicum]
MQLNPAQQAYHELALSLCETLEHLRRLNANAKDIRALTALTVDLNKAMAGFRSDAPVLPVYQPRDLSGGIEWMMPYSPVSGPCNPVAPRLHFHRQENRLVADVCFGVLHEGPPGTVHGGVLAAVYDQLFANANLINKTGGYTASLTIDFRRPTLLGAALRFCCWIERTEGRKVWVHGECVDGLGEVLTTARAIFIHVDSIKVEAPEFDI